ncbi:MAG TPA: FAD binding domain-containing protein [Dehalococcoidia bacterium]
MSVLPPVLYLRPSTLEEAVRALDRPGAVPLAGGTDLLVALQRPGEHQDRPPLLVDIKGIAEAQGIRQTASGLRIGALATAAQLAGDPLVWAEAAALAEAARATAAPALRRRATLGGNLCTPHPAGDVATALVALGAEVEIAGRDGRRTVDVEAFLSRRDRALQPGELVLAALIPGGQRSAFEKFGSRLAFSRALVAAAVARRNEGLRVALGGVGPRPLRARHAEDAVGRGGPLEDAVVRDCVPPDDETASRWYRLRLAGVLVRRCLEMLEGG